MKKIDTDTIVALATPPGRGGIAIVRISGPLVQTISTKMLKRLPTPRVASHLSFFDGDDVAIDEGLAVFFPLPNSFTGEDVLELHGHGGPVVVDILIKEIVKNGARLARPGEFSERAFMNDKLDLVQAEAVADLIDASSEQAARSAIRSLKGEFSQHIDTLVERLVKLRMYVEASIDFAEEEVDFLADEQVEIDLAKIIADLHTVQNSAVQGSLLRDGITVVIAGEPNVGKSSLLNRLSGKDIAIVTNIPGTTRDLLREQIIIDGMPLHIIDTAGLRDSIDIVEQEGIRRAHQEIAQADLVLLVVDASHDSTRQVNILKEVPPTAPIITIRNKIDLTKEAPTTQMDNMTVSLSAKEGTGIDFLRNQIKLSVGYQVTAEGCFSARRRHLDALSRAKVFLLSGQEQLTNHRAGELLAEDLRQAQLALSEITGEFSSDDLLGRIFSSFCIGK